MKISIIIVNYNVKYFLEQCLHSVLNACKDIVSEIIVVDNASSDGSSEWLVPRFPTVKFIWLPGNLGFARANNLALKECSGTYVLFLNPDTILPEDCFSRCLNFFENTRDCGALGVRMIDGSGRFLPESKRSFPTAASALYKMSGLARVFPASTFAHYHASHLAEKKTGEVEVLAGAFLLARKLLLEEIGSFDEDFFMYGEDIDLSYRVNKAGFKNYYFPEVTIIHFKGESTQKLSPAYVKRFYGAMSLFVRKHRQPPARYAMLAAIGIARAFANLRTLLKRAVATRSQKSTNGNETLVIGTHHQFNRVVQLLKYAVPPQQVIGRLAVEENDSQPSIGKFRDTSSMLEKYKPANIILCEGMISFSKLIQLTEEFGNKAVIWFHSNGSNSIVSSQNKAAKGESVSDQGKQT